MSLDEGVTYYGGIGIPGMCNISITTDPFDHNDAGYYEPVKMEDLDDIDRLLRIESAARKLLLALPKREEGNQAVIPEYVIVELEEACDGSA